jgi:small-conductance mechanosensitive channel
VTAVKKSYLLALAVWPLFLVTAVTLGAIREGLIAPALGEQAAHVIGTLVFIAAMLTIMWVFVSRTKGALRRRDLWFIGVMWTIMTVCFEFGFFHFVAGVPWEKLLADYNLFAGRLWLLVLLTTLCGPALLGQWLSGTEEPHVLSSRDSKQS